jgi:UDP-N-acetylglucosamine 2-epimerase (hydrolysing)
MSRLKKVMSKKRILFLTSTRADFSKLKSLILTLQKNKNFDVNVFVTGMHLLKSYGYTINELYRSKIKNIYKFKNQNEKLYSMTKSLASTVNGLSQYILRKNIDLIVIHGDRMEALAGAIAGTFNNIHVGHIEGGELSGTIDESIRHAVSKLSHFHFVSNKESKKRLIQMGEDKKTIFMIGSPDLDIMKSKNLPNLQDSKIFYGIKFNNYSIIIFHPVTTNKDENHKNLKIIDRIVNEELDQNFICINPNNDPGSLKFLRLYKKLKKKRNFICFPSMRFEYFLTFLKYANCIIGNSSTGVREAPFYGVNCINVGTRQNNRTKDSKLIYNSDDYNDVIKSFAKIIKKGKTKYKEKIFGSGNSNKKMQKILSGNKFWKLKIQKTFNDLDKT